MPIAGSPKKLAQDIADGYLMVTPPMLKLYTSIDFKTIVANIGIVCRELRQELIPTDDAMAIKAKNMKLSRLNQAEMVIKTYSRSKECPCDRNTTRLTRVSTLDHVSQSMRSALLP